jgi:hypothetical protein
MTESMNITWSVLFYFLDLRECFLKKAAMRGLSAWPWAVSRAIFSNSYSQVAEREIPFNPKRRPPP